MRILVDTNVLGRYSQPTHSCHPAALNAVERLGKEGHELRLVPQLAYEFWVVATRPLAQNGFAFTAEEAFEAVEAFIDLFRLLRDERGVFEPWLEFVHTLPCLGKVAHDARLVAAMEKHSMTHILTFNGGDFARFRNIHVVDPRNVPAG
jgi:predicted nucleic acid-binding protein